jgi:putative DNA primase/helicase
MTGALDLFATERLWVAWVEECRGQKPTKTPYRSPGQRAKSNAPRTWLTRTAAETLARRIVNGSAGGIGIMLGSGRGGVDLDTCYDPESGTLLPWAEEVLQRFATYAEVSSSGRGVKLFFLYDIAALPELQNALGTDVSGNPKFGASWKRKANGRDHPPGIECYLDRRYFAVTEQHLDGTPAELRVVPTDVLLWLIREAGPAVARDGEQPQDETGKARDQSRSAAAFRLAAKLLTAGASDDEMVTALLADPATAEWTDKGTGGGCASAQAPVRASEYRWTGSCSSRHSAPLQRECARASLHCRACA